VTDREAPTHPFWYRPIDQKSIKRDQKMTERPAQAHPYATAYDSTTPCKNVATREEWTPVMCQHTCITHLFNTNKFHLNGLGFYVCDALICNNWGGLLGRRKIHKKRSKIRGMCVKIKLRKLCAEKIHLNILDSKRIWWKLLSIQFDHLWSQIKFLTKQISNLLIQKETKESPKNSI
jgi:hypothetical protein